MSTRLTNTADKPDTLPHITIASTCLFNGPFPSLISTTKINLKKSIYHCLLLPQTQFVFGTPVRRPDETKGPSMICLLQSRLLQSRLPQSLLSLSSHPEPIPPHLSSKAWSSQHLPPENLPHLAPARISFLDGPYFHPQFASKIYTAKRSGSQFAGARFIAPERSLFSTNYSTGRIVKPMVSHLHPYLSDTS